MSNSLDVCHVCKTKNSNVKEVAITISYEGETRSGVLCANCITSLAVNFIGSQAEEIETPCEHQWSYNFSSEALDHFLCQKCGETLRAVAVPANPRKSPPNCS